MYLVIGRNNCSYCDKAKEALKEKGTPYVYVDITSGDSITDAIWKKFLVEDLEAKTVPQIFRLLGGYDDLRLELLHVPNKE
jgi:glutaredoxin